METKIIGKVGPTAQKDGTENEIRLAVTGEQVVSQDNPNYYEGSSRAAMWSGANTSAQAVSVGLATTYTGLILYNPVNSGKVLVPTFVKFALSVAPAAIATIGLITGYAATGGVTALTTPLIPQCNLIGNAATGVGRVLSAATIITPVWSMQLVDGFTAAALPAPSAPVDLKGMFTILPGGFIAIGALTAVTGLGSISWKEVQIV